jgi:hypothetical protein
MAAKTWETDFRFPAIRASIRALGNAYHDDPFAFPGSFCTPVAEKPVVGWTPGRITLIAIILGFALLIGGAMLGARAEKQRPGADSDCVLAVAACCSLLGIVTFFLPAKLDRQIICRLLGDRGRELIERSSLAKTMTAELSDADRAKMRKISIDGDDHLLILFDEKDHRLMIEGIGARYQIRAADVEKLTPFEFLNYLGVEITYRIDSETSLRVAIARVSMLLELIRQVPVLSFLRGRISNKLLERSVRTLLPTGKPYGEMKT